MIISVIRWSIHNRLLVVLATLVCSAGALLVARTTPIDALVLSQPFYAKADVPAKMYRGTDVARASFGMVATVVLILMFIFVSVFVWMGS